MSLTTDLKGQSSITQHIFYRGKPLGKFAKTTSSCSHLSLCNLLCCTLYLAFLPLCHCTLPISSLYHPVPCSIITLSVCALCPALSHYTPSISISHCTFLIHFISFICSAFLSVSYLLLSLHICRETRQDWKCGASTPAAVFKTEWGYQPFCALPPAKCVRNLCCHFCPLYLSAPEHPFSSVLCFIAWAEGRKSIMWNIATQYDAVFNFWTWNLLRGVCRFEQVKFKDIVAFLDNHSSEYF